MKLARVLVLLTAVNLGLLICQLARVNPVQAQNSPGMLRGTGLELVDSQGRVRAQMQVLPGDPDFKTPVVVSDHMQEDFPNPRENPVVVRVPGTVARYVRLTAARLTELAVLAEKESTGV